MKLVSICIFIIGFSISGCTINKGGKVETLSESLRIFHTSFESVSDFSGFYIVPPGAHGSSHEMSTEQVYSGSFSHKAWIEEALAKNNDRFNYKPHRAYPTVQFQKTKDGVLKKPVLITLWVYVDIKLEFKQKGSINDWLSLVTITPDITDAWRRTMLVNVGPDEYLRLMHVPRQGKQEYIFQAGEQNDTKGSMKFPQKVWNRIDMYVDLDQKNGYAKVWQNGVLISHAKVQGGDGQLAQAHFGLYASAAVGSGTVFNDELTIREVRDEKEALSFIEKK